MLIISIFKRSNKKKNRLNKTIRNKLNVCIKNISLNNIKNSPRTIPEFSVNKHWSRARARASGNFNQKRTVPGVDSGIVSRMKHLTHTPNMQAHSYSYLMSDLSNVKLNNIEQCNKEQCNFTGFSKIYCSVKI